MGSNTTMEILLGILYATGSLALLITAYFLYLKRFKRNKLEAMNDITFETSIDNRYSSKTQFLVHLPKPEKIKLELLDKSENPIKILLENDLEPGQHTVDFNPSEFQVGEYYLSLVSENTKILRKITIIE